MAVQAQYPSSVLFLNRGEPEMKGMDCAQSLAGMKPRKRGREPMASMPLPPPAAIPSQQHSGTIDLLSLQPQVPATTMISLSQLQMHPSPPTFVSTGLKLAFEDQSHTQSNGFFSPPPSSSPMVSSFLAHDLAVQIGQQRDEIDRFLYLQGEQLRRAVAETSRRYTRSLIAGAGDSVVQRLREKEAEVERAACRATELEDRLARLRSESMAWQAKALADQAVAANLHAQLQQAMAAGAAYPGETNEPPADDAESAHVDPGRVEPSRACRACLARPVSVVLMPCRHLCLCSDCDSAARFCPVCRSPRAGGVEVLFS